MSGAARHSEEYLDNISGDCHHGAEAETRGGSSGNLHPTLPAAGTCHFVTNHKTSFVILYYLLSMQKKNIQYGKKNIVDNAHVTSVALEQASLQCKERHLSQLMADRDQVRQ